jgi:hypothetical protein
VDAEFRGSGIVRFDGGDFVGGDGHVGRVGGAGEGDVGEVEYLRGVVWIGHDDCFWWVSDLELGLLIEVECTSGEYV